MVTDGLFQLHGQCRLTPLILAHYMSHLMEIVGRVLQQFQWM